MFRLTILLVSVASLIAIGAFMVSVDRLERALVEPAPGPALERVVVVPERAELPVVMRQLAGEGLVVDASWISLYADRLVQPRVLKPGEYALSSEMSPLLQISRMESGAVLEHTVMLSPGVTAEEAIEALAREGLQEVAGLREALTDEALLAATGAEGAPSLEGFLMPDAYTLPKGLDADALLGKLVGRFTAFAEAKRRTERPLFDVVRVASLVQTSKVKSREWRIYAALLYNRLDAGIPLDHPRSAAYGRTKGLSEAKNPYRTDRKAGLPPTPICNPGPDALAAALDPAKTDAKFMVRREDGSHFYCPDRECARAAERARQGLPPVAPPVAPPPPPVVDPTPVAPPQPLVVPGKPLNPEPPSEESPL